MDLERKIFSKLEKKSRSPVDLKVVDSKVKYFYLKKDDKYTYLKSKLRYMKDKFLEMLEISDFKPTNFISKSSFYTFGAIIFKKEDAFLFSNIDESNDVLVKLNLEYVNRYSLYPGQVIIVKGKNLGNNELIVEDLNCMCMIETNATVNKDSCNIKVISGATGRSISEDNNLIVDEEIFEELNDLSEEINAEDSSKKLENLRSRIDIEENIDLLILFGIEYSSIKDLMLVLEEKLEMNKHLKIVFVPTLEDRSFINIFPQSSSKSGLERLFFVSNPSQIYVNGKLISINTYDNLSELLKHERIRNTKKEGNDACGKILFKGDEIDRWCYHLIFQRSYLLVSPSENNVQYDFDALNMDVVPDFYIIRSKLSSFSRRVGPCNIVNIGKGMDFYVKIEQNNFQISDKNFN